MCNRARNDRYEIRMEPSSRHLEPDHPELMEEPWSAPAGVKAPRHSRSSSMADGSEAAHSHTSSTTEHGLVQYSPSSVLRHSMSGKKRRGMGVFLSSFFGRMYEGLLREAAEESSGAVCDPQAEAEARARARCHRNLLVANKPETFLLSLVLHHKAQSEIGQ